MSIVTVGRRVLARAWGDKPKSTRLARAVIAACETLEARWMLTAEVYNDNFEGTPDPRGQWSGGSVTAAPAVSGLTGFHFMGPATDLTLKLNQLRKRYYALDVSATLYLMGDKSPANRHDPIDPGDELSTSGLGGGQWKVNLGDDTTPLFTADFGLDDYWYKGQSYGGPDDSHVSPVSDESDVWLGYDTYGEVWVSDPGGGICGGTASHGTYTVHFIVPVKDMDSVSIKFQTESAGDMKFALDNVVVNQYVYSICRTCSGNPDGEPLQSTTGVASNVTEASASRGDPGDIGAGNGALEIPELFWIGPDEAVGGSTYKWTTDPAWVGDPMVAVYTIDSGIPVWFDATRYPSPSFTAKDGYQGKLALDTTDDWLILTDPEGGRTFYQGDTGDHPGQFVKYIDADDNMWEATVDYEGGPITGIHQTDGDQEAINYDFDGDGDQLSGVSVTRSPVSGTYTVRSASYDYYSGSETYGGNAGDLEFEHIDSGTTETDVSYYRYWKTSDSDFNSAHEWAGAPKFDFGPQAYARLVAAYPGTAVTDLSDLQVKDYADTYYKSYDNPNDRRVTEEVVAGQGDLLLSTTTRPTNVTSVGTNLATVDGYNIWKYRTETTYADNTKDIVYKNFLGDTMLETFKDASGNERPVMFYEYGEESYNADKVILQAYPSAFQLVSSKYYDDTKADLLNATSGNYAYLSDNSGKVEITDYYAADGGGIADTVPGAAGGYLEDTILQQGEIIDPGRSVSITRSSGVATVTLASHGFHIGDQVRIIGAAQGEYDGLVTVTGTSSGSFTFAVSGSPASPATGTILAYANNKDLIEAKYDYYKHDNGGSGTNLATIYPLADAIQYSGPVGTGARTTTYKYGFASKSNRMVWRETTQPVIGTGQNGPGTADTSIEVYDHRGRTIYTIDGDNYVNHYEYDDATDAVTKTVVDSDTPYIANILADGPLGYWRLDETSGTAISDSSGNGQSGTSSGTLTFAQSGALTGDSDKALDFGGGKITLPDHLLSDALSGGSASVEAWFKTTGDGVIFGYGNNSTPGSATDYVPALYVGTDNKLHGSLWEFSDTTTIASSVNVNDGSWHYVAVTASGSTLKLYLDGNLVGTLSGTITPLDMDHNWIGDGRWASWADTSGSTAPFSGTIDDFAVYGQALSADRVADHYSAGEGAIANRTGLNLTTLNVVDAQGRTTKMTDPNGNVTYVVYDDADHEVRTYPGFNGTNTTGPIQISREDRAGSYTEELTVAVAPHLTSGVPDGTESFTGTNIRSLTRTHTNSFGQTDETDRFFNMSGISSYATGIASLHMGGTAGANYYATTYAYDTLGRQNKVVNPLSTITRTVYDSMGRQASTWVGTDDTETPIYKFDFGTSSSPVASGYTKATDAAYTNTAGFGWLAGSSVSATNRSSGSDLDRDFVSTTSNGTFGVDLSDGVYWVTVTVGDQTTAHDQQGIYLEGSLVDSIDTSAGTFYEKTYRVTVLDGQLTLRLEDLGGSDATAVINGLVITPDWTPGSPVNMTKVSENLYDTYDPAITVVGDSNLTRMTNFPTGTNSAQVTEMYYDWRDRQVASKSGVLLNGSNQDTPAGETNSASVQQLISYTTYDNLDEVIQQDQYEGDGVVMVTSNAPTDSTPADGVPDAPGTNRLRARMTSDYDDQGRVWQSKVFSVNQTSGAPGNSLKSWTWYGHRGNVIKTLVPGGLVTKYVYDGAGQTTKVYTTDGAGDAAPGGTSSASWDNAGTLNGNTVLEQSEMQYDDDGNEIFSTVRMRFHDANAPGTNSTDLAVSPASASARASYQAFYYDNANRLTDSVDVGTYGGSAYSRPGSAPTNRTDTLLLTHTDYNDSGWASSVTDPRGLVSNTYYDLLGRTTKTIANYVDGVASGGADDQTTEYTYDGNDDILFMKAVLNNSGGTNNAFQTTQYIYGVTTGGGSGVNSNDLLAQTIYPDTISGLAGTNSTYIESFKYDAIGEKSTYTDRNGSVHTYSYDVLGRLTLDTVTTLGSGVDGAVRQLGYAFDTAGHPYQMTSYSSSNGGSIVNQTQYAYNGYGQLTAEYQDHGDCGVSIGSSPVVQYTYSEGGDNSGPTNNNSRLTSIIYPNGRTVRYEYGTSGGLADKISRLAFLADDTNGSIGPHIEDYSYLGLSTVVIRDRPNANSTLTLVKQAGEGNGDAGDQYTGLDRFGRIVDQRWIGQSGSSTTTLDRFQYGYDRDSNPLYKNNLGPGSNAASFSELYHGNGTSAANTQYDGLNRLTDFSRGTLSDVNSDGVYDTVTTPNTLTGSVKNWSLDAVGNWNSTTTGGGTNTAVMRSTNAQNELTAIGGNTIGFDSAGNTTADDAGLTYTYDAWNRMVSAKSGTNTVQAFSYDAGGRRITENAGTAVDLYYSNQWQVLQEDNSGLAKDQYVWSPFYVDDLIERDRDADTSADGTLDSSFGTSGKVTTSIAGSAQGVAVLPDGRIIVAGTSSGDFAVARYSAAGVLDTTFGTSGETTTDIGSSTTDAAYAVAVQSDGKILVAGYTSNGGSAHFAIVRYTAEGVLDTTFNSTGKQTISFNSFDFGFAVSIQPDGKIVIGGLTIDTVHGDEDFAVARLNSDGSLDTSFNSSGINSVHVSGGQSEAFSMALQSDGKIVVGGFSDTGSGDKVSLARFNANGTLDTGTFASGTGVEVTSLSGVIQGLKIQADGKIVVAAVSGNDFAVARFNTDGSFDTSFNSTGYRVTDVGSSTTDGAYALSIQSDGKIVAGGVSAGNFAILRYNTDGTLDTTFDTDGKLTTDFGGTDQANALVIGPDYKIVAAGFSGSNWALARYKVSSSLEERLYVETDANHNVTSISDVFGTVKERFVYDPYRNSTVLSSDWTSTSDGFSWVIRSQGKREDTVTHTLESQRRVFGLGDIDRWMQADMAGYVDGANRYQFVKSNPIDSVDSSGLAGYVWITTPPMVISNVLLEMTVLEEPTIKHPKNDKEHVEIGNQVVQWKLTNLQPGVQGTIFQHVTIDQDVHDGVEQPITPEEDSVKQFWEVWEVKNGVIGEMDAGVLVPGDRDTFWMRREIACGQFGSFSIKSSAFFLPIPNPISPDNANNIEETGGAPATTMAPFSWWDIQDPGTIHREMTYSFDYVDSTTLKESLKVSP